MTTLSKDINMRVKAKISFKLNHTSNVDAKRLVEVAMNYALLKLSENNSLSAIATVTAIDLK